MTTHVMEKNWIVGVQDNENFDSTTESHVRIVPKLRTKKNKLKTFLPEKKDILHFGRKA